MRQLCSLLPWNISAVTSDRTTAHDESSLTLDLKLLYDEGAMNRNVSEKDAVLSFLDKPNREQDSCISPSPTDFQFCCELGELKHTSLRSDVHDVACRLR